MISVESKPDKHLVDAEHRRVCSREHTVRPNTCVSLFSLSGNLSAHLIQSNRRCRYRTALGCLFNTHNLQSSASFLWSAQANGSAACTGAFSSSVAFTTLALQHGPVEILRSFSTLGLPVVIKFHWVVLDSASLHRVIVCLVCCERVCVWHTLCGWT